MAEVESFDLDDLDEDFEDVDKKGQKKEASPETPRAKSPEERRKQEAADRRRERRERRLIEEVRREITGPEKELVSVAAFKFKESAETAPEKPKTATTAPTSKLGKIFGGLWKGIKKGLSIFKKIFVGVAIPLTAGVIAVKETLGWIWDKITGKKKEAGGKGK